MDADVSMDTDAILLLGVYAQFCVCAIHRYPKYPVSAILDMCEYVQYMQYYHILRRTVAAWQATLCGAPRHALFDVYGVIKSFSCAVFDVHHHHTYTGYEYSA